MKKTIHDYWTAKGYSLYANDLIDEYIHFYNFERIQLKTKLTPYEKRCQFA